MYSTTNISHLLNIPNFQTLQDTISSTTDLAIITVDYKGIPITTHSGCSEFCQLVRQNPLSAKYCQKCDSRGGLEAVRLNKPYIYLCHYNLVDLAVPIIADNKYIGAIMAGQVKLSNLPCTSELEQIISSTSNHSLIMNMSSYKQAYDKIPHLNYDTLLKYAELIQSFSNYIISEATEKIKIINTASSPASQYVYCTNHSNSMLPTRELPSLDPTRNMFESDSTNPPIPDIILTPRTYTFDSAREVIQPLLNYIQAHPNSFLSSFEASELCNVSPSYFSKSFKKVMTVSYTEYITEVKLMWAKEFLVLSNNSIEKISDKLGFNSTSYFIKIFKKHENLTPSLYRKYYNTQQNS